MKKAIVIVVLAVGVYWLYQQWNARPKPAAPTVETPERVVVRKPFVPIHFLHQTFTVDKYQAFPFEVPPRIVTPKLHGTFQSSIKRSNGDVSGEVAEVEMMLMNPEQYSAFTHGRSATSIYAVDPSSHQEVQYTLAPTLDDPAKYFLVFRSDSGGPRSVKADFELTAD